MLIPPLISQRSPNSSSSIGRKWPRCTVPGMVPPRMPTERATSSLWIELGAPCHRLTGCTQTPWRGSAVAASMVVLPLPRRSLATSGQRHHALAHHLLEVLRIEQLAVALGQIRERPLEPPDRIVGTLRMRVVAGEHVEVGAGVADQVARVLAGER